MAGLALVNPAVNIDRKDVKLLPVLKHVVPSFSAIGNDIKKPGVVEDAYTRTPLKAADSMLKGYKALRADLAQDHLAHPVFRSVEDHVVDPSSARIIASSVSSRDYRGAPPRGQLPRRHPGQRRRADLHGVRRVHLARHRLTPAGYRGLVSAQDEDELWRSIVDNYGDRAELDEPVDDGSPVPPEPAAAPDGTSRSGSSRRRPPPLPRPENKRLVAWAGVFGVPILLLVCLVTGISLPALLAYAMVGWFVGGFVYLVLLMPRGPRDPDDDGARL